MSSRQSMRTAKGRDEMRLAQAGSQLLLLLLNIDSLAAVLAPSEHTPIAPPTQVSQHVVDAYWQLLPAGGARQARGQRHTHRQLRRVDRGWEGGHRSHNKPQVQQAWCSDPQKPAPSANSTLQPWGTPPHLLNRQQRLLVPPASGQQRGGHQVLQSLAKLDVPKARLPARSQGGVGGGMATTEVLGRGRQRALEMAEPTGARGTVIGELPSQAHHASAPHLRP